MPTTLRTSQYYKTMRKKRNYTQTVCMMLGCLMVLLGLAGILNPAFMGMHLSGMHSLVLTATGALGIWAALNQDPHKAYYVSIGLGIFYAIHAVAGFLLGEPGDPRVGYEARDELLLRIAPGFLELGTVDHFVHAFFTILFLTAAISWRRHKKK